ncbi:LysR family transcriptional regulator [Actinomycetospora termitidis]|uniref:LysR family transcriptional regulator n=1 Tax=Actinomycetospora termitidis TaxID=3053470 RepID=A0ABT7MIG1_9PSEU|nr:LysR family transcriptional regulator [Actinomycetospora sp. Odt1-22]MDL5159677.1 LysR family transcriptional regulator [Actinomycetospora sp. Odt1-22]
MARLDRMDRSAVAAADEGGELDGLDDNFSLQKLHVLCAVVAHGGVGKAAAELFVSQPVVTSHVRSLERRLGARLFERDGRGITLTEAGVHVHRWALEVLRGRRELAQSLHQIAAGTWGSVAVAASMSAGNSLLTPVLIDFRRDHPDVRVTATNSSVEAALEMTQSGRADFCVVGTDAVLDSRAYTATKLGEPRFVLVAAVGDTSVGASVTVGELSQLPFVTPPAGLAIRRSQDAALAELGVVDRRVELELGSAEAIKQAVAAGLGVALLWSVSVRADIERGDLREVRVEGPLRRDRLYLVTRVGKRLSPVQARLRERILSEVPELLHEG